MAHLPYRLIALFDNNPGLKPPFSDVPLYLGQAGFELWQKTQSEPEAFGSGAMTSFLVAIGGARGSDRIQRQLFLEAAGLNALTAIHPTAFVAPCARILSGSQILAGAIVGVESNLGKGCIVNTGATVDHDCVLGDGVHVCPGANLAGEITVGQYATIGTGAVILPGLSIGANAIIGAGAVVTSHVPAGATVVGNPARLIASQEQQFKKDRID